MVLDNYFQPGRLRVRQGRARALEVGRHATEVHDVKLARAPRGVRRWQSIPGGYSYVYRRRLRVSGTYRFVCTFHVNDGMPMTIVVGRR